MFSFPGTGFHSGFHPGVSPIWGQGIAQCTHLLHRSKKSFWIFSLFTFLLVIQIEWLTSKLLIGRTRSIALIFIQKCSLNQNFGESFLHWWVLFFWDSEASFQHYYHLQSLRGSHTPKNQEVRRTMLRGDELCSRWVRENKNRSSSLWYRFHITRLSKTQVMRIGEYYLSLWQMF